MKTRTTAIILFLCATIQIAAQSIGSWKAYPAFSEIKTIENTGNLVYVLASDNLYSYNPSDKSILTYTKVSVLNDAMIDNIAWNKTAQRLIVVYKNYNIDLLSPDGQTVNIPDYYNKTTTADKTVNSIAVNGYDAYLSTGFGVLKVNMRDAYISDTYNLGMNVLSTIIVDNEIFASTSSGIYRAVITDNLADKNVWQMVTTSVYQKLFKLGDKIIGLNNGSADIINPRTGAHSRFYAAKFARCSYDGSHILCYGASHSYIINQDLTVTDIPRKLDGMAYGKSEGTCWTGSDGTLQSVTVATDGTLTTIEGDIRPDGPKYNDFGFFKYMSGRLYTATGVVEKRAGIQVLKEGEWHIYDDSFKTAADDLYLGAYALAVDPKNADHVFLGAQTGLYEFENGKNTNIFNMTNSPIQYAGSLKPTDNLRRYNLVKSVCFSPDGSTLWALNSEAKSSPMLAYKDKKWTVLNPDEIHDNTGNSFHDMEGLFFDSRGLMWFVNNNHVQPALVCFRPSDEAIKVYDKIVNQDGTSAVDLSAVTCAAEDKEGNIWIGTNIGPYMLPASQIGTDNETFTQVKIPRNDGTNLADYLLSGVYVTDMAIDGAGRKWFVTSDNGAYLISADNLTETEHFTKDNSPLLSNAIQAVSVNDDTGEVFFGTTSGLCSYQSDASKPSDNMTKDNVWAYPNPVRPDYQGPITITGLTLDADIKIATTNGTLVAEGRSTGGTFVWNGLDMKGRRVASGVYMVEAATAEGGKGTVCKIAIIR